MKAKTLLILLMIMASPVASASSVFTCIGDNGETTFSFEPCGKPEPVVVARVEQTPKFSRKDRLAELDQQIAETKKELMQVRVEYQQSLRSVSTATESNDLTTAFDTNTSQLIDHLSELRAQRREVSQRF